MSYETVIGLEVHVQLRTRTKMFCSCPNSFGGEPNSRVCPVCLGYPGTLPVANPRAIELAIQLALALGCDVQPRSTFARKNYFYPDLPKGYQISQFAEPLAEHGTLPLIHGGRSVAIRRLHLEEDAGKLLHETPGGGPLPGKSLVDFNRCGVPLVEIVTEPSLRTPEEAQDYAQSLHQVLLYTGVSDGSLEEGSLRCDANISLRPAGSTTLGAKVEVKNLNSFRNLTRALEYEVERQTTKLETGGEVEVETRSFDAATGATRTLRSKEEAHDYRYFPEPDLPHVRIDLEQLEEIAEALPEMPWSLRERLQAQYSLGREEAEMFAAQRDLAVYFESVAAEIPSSAIAVANWVRTEVVRELNARGEAVSDAPAPERLAELVAMVDDSRLSSTGAKTVFAELWGSTDTPEEISARLGLVQVQDEAQLQRWVTTIVDEYPEAVSQLRNGEEKVLGFLVGQVMRRSRGSADPVLARQLLVRAVSVTPARD